MRVAFSYPNSNTAFVLGQEDFHQFLRVPSILLLVKGILKLPMSIIQPTYVQTMLSNPDVLSGLAFAMEVRLPHKLASPLLRLSELGELLESRGVRTGNRSFEGIIDQAKLRGHPDGEWLTVLADVLGERKDISALDAWPAWEEQKKPSA